PAGGPPASAAGDGEKPCAGTARLPPSPREAIGSIRTLMPPLKNGALVPLAAVAAVRMGSGRAAITRENARRYVGIRMNVRDRDMGSFVRQARTRVAAAVSLPPGYEITWGGEFENQERAMARLRLVIPLSLLLTFILLFLAFGPMWAGALIFLTVPLALLGGVLGLAAARMPLSVS